MNIFYHKTLHLLLLCLVSAGFNNGYSQQHYCKFTQNIVTNNDCNFSEPQNDGCHMESAITSSKQYLTEKGFEVPFSYDKQLQRNYNHAPLDSTWKYVDGMPVEINRMAYSEEGLLIKEEFFGVSWAGTIEEYPFARITYAYNEQGDLILDHYETVWFNGEELTFITLVLLEYAYDEMGNQVFYSFQSKDSNSDDLIKRRRWTATYHPEHQTQTYYLQETGYQNEWVSRVYRERVYSDDGDLLSVINKSAPQNGIWTTGKKHVYEDYLNGIARDVMVYSWSQNEQDWIPDSKFEYFVDETILQISIAHEYTWNALNEEWWHIKITEMFYDEGPLVQSAITRSREFPNYPFFNSSQEFFTWTAEGNLSFHLIQNWNHFHEEWVDHKRYSRDWNEAGQITTELTEAFDPAENEWVNVSRINREFNHNFRLTLFEDQLWSAYHGHWYYQRLTVFGYHSSGRINYHEWRVLQDPDGQLWNNASKTYFDFDDLGWQKLRRIYSWNILEQEFEFYSHNAYINDYYNNKKKFISYNEDLSQPLSITYGYSTYEVELQVVGQGIPLAGASIAINGQVWTADDTGMITMSLTLDDKMDVNYFISKDGYVSREGILTVDRHLSLIKALVPDDVQLYEVAFVVSDSGNLLPDAQITLSGYGSLYSDAFGSVVFSDIAPQQNIPFVVSYDGVVFEGLITVSDEDVLVEVDLATTGVSAEVFHNTSIEIFPNPASDRLTVTFSNGTDNKHTMAISDLSGRTVYFANNLQGVTTIDISRLPPGVYLVMINDNYRQAVSKLVVNR